MNRYTIETERISTVWYEVLAESEDDARQKWENYEGDTMDIQELDEDSLQESFGYARLDEEDIDY